MHILTRILTSRGPRPPGGTPQRPCGPPRGSPRRGAAPPGGRPNPTGRCSARLPPRTRRRSGGLRARPCATGSTRRKSAPRAPPGAGTLAGAPPPAAARGAQRQQGLPGRLALPHQARPGSLPRNRRGLPAQQVAPAVVAPAPGAPRPGHPRRSAVRRPPPAASRPPCLALEPRRAHRAPLQRTTSGMHLRGGGAGGAAGRREGARRTAVGAGRAGRLHARGPGGGGRPGREARKARDLGTPPSPPAAALLLSEQESHEVMAL